MKHKGKVILVTGATSGIGLATAQILANEGAEVFTAQRRKSADFHSIEVDLIEKGASKGVIETVISKAGRLDGLVNNAGLMLESRVDETSDEDWASQLQLNLTVPFEMIRASIRFLKVTQGSIVNVGSIEGLGSNPNHSAYCAAKAGLHGLTRAVAVDHGPNGVRCNAVAPGWIDTPINIDFIESLGDPDAFRAAIGSIHPIGRTGNTEEVGQLISWLLSKDASFVTGQIHVVDGGRMAKLSLP